MKAKKIDRRMNGYGEFKYMLDYLKSERVKFIKCREWCWEQWGPSCEYENWDLIEERNPAWCWAVSEYSSRIYFREEAQYSWYLLNFS